MQNVTCACAKTTKNTLDFFKNLQNQNFWKETRSTEASGVRVRSNRLDEQQD
jgi:hypothetical protein